MIEFATITPTRGDRPELLEFCKHQISRMTVKPAKSYFIGYPPTKFPDLVDRIRMGVQRARTDGFSFVFIVEDDDFYPADYFERIAPTDNDCFIGSEQTTYYNLRNKTYDSFLHPKRSSLFTTGFNLDCIKYFEWPKPETIFLDVEMWKFAGQKQLKRRFVETGAIGIKHNTGLVGGKGHKMTFKNMDEEMAWLKSKVDQESYIFYKSLKLKK
jgi:hypothetical protein